MSTKIRLPVLNDAPAPSPLTEQLPTLTETSLDWDGVDCVLADLDDFTDIREILGRPARGQPQPQGDIVEARDQFVAGELHGLQITYVFADELWVDTLLRSAVGARLLRMPAATTSPSNT